MVRDPVEDVLTAPPLDQFDGLLARIPEAIATTGYQDFLSCMVPGIVRLETWQRCAGLVDGEFRRLVGLFLLGERQPMAGLPAAVAEVLPALAAAGVARIDQEDQAQLSGLVLLFTRGIWLFAQPPQITPTFYLGDDSFGLAERLALRPGNCLDLCAGPGIQTLLCAQRGHRVSAVEINPVAAAVCRVNTGLNGMSDRVTVRCGDLFAAVGGEEFDNITANPPLVPIPASVPYPFVGDGGPDGLSTVRRILAGLPDHMSRSGQAQIIGMALSDGFLPLMLDELSDYAGQNGMAITVTVTAHLPVTSGAPWVTSLAQTAALHAGSPQREAEQAVASGYLDLGASHLCVYALRIRRGDGTLQYIDLSQETGGGLWFV
jgi:release factor glutamine methyltransferase